MQALTIELPETDYRAALAFTPEERQRLFAVALAAAEATRQAAFAEAEEADIQAVGRGLEAEARGETIPGDVAFAQLMEQARHGLK